MRLRKAAFDAAADAKYGADTPDWRIAEALGTDKSSLSLLRHGHRQPSTEFIANVLHAFGDATFEDLFEYYAAPASASSRRRAAA